MLLKLTWRTCYSIWLRIRDLANGYDVIWRIKRFEVGQGGVVVRSESVCSGSAGITSNSGLTRLDTENPDWASVQG